MGASTTKSQNFTSMESMAKTFLYGLDTYNPILFITAKGIRLVDAPESNMQLCKTKSPMHKEIKKVYV